MAVFGQVRIGVCGEFQVGKSMLINCLLGGEVALVGDRLATTAIPVTYQWAAQAGAELLLPDGTVACRFSTAKAFVDCLAAEHATEAGRARLRHLGEARVGLPRAELQSIALVDTPGFNAEGADESKANAVLGTLDFALFVTRNKQLEDAERRALRRIRGAGVPFAIVMNCYDQLGEPSPAHPVNQSLAKALAATARNLGASPTTGAEAKMLVVNAQWHQAGGAPGFADESDQKPVDRVLSAPDEESGDPTHLRAVSGMEDLRRFVFPEPERRVGLNALGVGALQRAVREWAQEAKQEIGRMRSAMQGTN